MVKGLEGPALADKEKNESVFEALIEEAKRKMLARGLDARQMQFNLKKPMTISFFKRATHSTHNVVSHLWYSRN